MPVFAAFPAELLADCEDPVVELNTVRDLALESKQRGAAIAQCNRDKAKLRELQEQHRSSLP